MSPSHYFILFLAPHFSPALGVVCCFVDFGVEVDDDVFSLSTLLRATNSSYTRLKIPNTPRLHYENIISMPYAA